jgi:hypothetical protein
MTERPDAAPDGPSAAFARTADAAQRTAGIIAARARGDFDGAQRLLASMDDHTRAAGGLFLADLAVSLLAYAEGRSADQVAAELSLHVASVGPQLPR